MAGEAEGGSGEPSWVVGDGVERATKVAGGGVLGVSLGVGTGDGTAVDVLLDVDPAMASVGAGDEVSLIEGEVVLPPSWDGDGDGDGDDNVGVTAAGVATVLLSRRDMRTRTDRPLLAVAAAPVVEDALASSAAADGGVADEAAGGGTTLTGDDTFN